MDLVQQVLRLLKGTFAIHCLNIYLYILGIPYMDTSFKGHVCSHFFPLWLHWASCDISEYFLPSRFFFLCPLIDQSETWIQHSRKQHFLPVFGCARLFALKNWQCMFQLICLVWRSSLGRICREGRALCGADLSPFLELFSVSGWKTLVPCHRAHALVVSLLFLTVLQRITYPAD